jgi:HJR/Mrr/RecB family endonuclease
LIKQSEEIPLMHFIQRMWAEMLDLWMAMQCKHYKSRKAGVAVVRELIGAMKLADPPVGLIFYTNQFTWGAYKQAKGNKIIHWDIEEVLRRTNRNP